MVQNVVVRKWATIMLVLSTIFLGSCLDKIVGINGNESITYNKQTYYRYSGFNIEDVQYVEDGAKVGYTNCFAVVVEEQGFADLNRMYMYDDGSNSYIYDGYDGFWYINKKSEDMPAFSTENVERISIWAGEGKGEYILSAEEKQDFITSIFENCEKETPRITIEDEEYENLCWVNVTYRGQPSSSYWTEFSVLINGNEVIVNKEGKTKKELFEGAIELPKTIWAQQIYQWLNE